VSWLQTFNDVLTINAPDFVDSGTTLAGGPAVTLTTFRGFYLFNGATPGDVDDARAGGHWIEGTFTTSSDFVDGGVRIVSLSHLPRSNVPYRYTAAISSDGFATETVLASDHSWLVAAPAIDNEFALDPDTTYAIRWYAHNSTDQVGNPNVNGTGHRFDDLRLNFVVDSDGDGLQNSLDLDSDNDGIPDNVEAQSTQDFVAPVNVDDGNGLFDVYESAPGAGEGLTPVNTEGAGAPDYLDLDTDDDGTLDIVESGQNLTDGDEDGRTDGVVGRNGLDNAVEAANTDDYIDVNGLSHDGTDFVLSDTDNDTDDDGANAAPTTTDFDWRDVPTAELEVTKTAGTVAAAASGTQGNVDVTYEVTVTNDGPVAVADISLVDDLDDQLGVAFVDVVAGPTVTGDLAAARANAGFDGDDNIDLLTADIGEALAPTEAFTVEFTIEFDPDADLTLLPLSNVAIATAAPPSGPSISVPSPPEPVEASRLTLDKTVVEHGPAASGIAGNVDVTFALELRNIGTEGIGDITLIDDLASQFGATFQGVTVAPVVVGDLAPTRANADFDGVTDPDLLTTDVAEELRAGGSITVTFTAEIDPDGDLAVLPLTNVAQASGTGIGPVPNPPLVVTLPSLRAAKDVAAQANAASGVEGNIDVTYEFVVLNNGSEDAVRVALSDDLQTQFGSAFVGVTTAPAVTNIDATAAPIGNAGYDGTGDLLDGTALVQPTQAFLVNVTVEVDPDADGAPEELSNIAEVSGSTPSEPIPPRETSIGTNPEDEPGPVTLLTPEIRAIQSLDVDNNGDGTFSVAIVVEGINTGQTLLNDVDLEMELDTTFAAVQSWSIRFGTFGVGRFETQALALGTSPAGDVVQDLSATNIDDDAPIEFILFEDLDVGGAKEVDEVERNADGTADFTYRVHVENFGNVVAQNLNVRDDLTATFPGLSFEVLSVQSSDLTVNPNYDGDSDQMLLAGVDTLLVGVPGGDDTTAEPTTATTESAKPPAALAFTGRSTGQVVLVALLLLILGLALIAWRRRLNEAPA